MGQFEELWLYCKETFGLVKRHPLVFVPKLIFLGILTVLIVAMAGSGFMQHLTEGRVPFLSISVVLSVVIMLISLLLITAGEQNLFKKAALDYDIDFKDFGDGIRLFTKRIIIGGFLQFLITAVVGLVFMVFMAIPFFNVIAAFAMMIIMFIINVYLSTWKAAMAFKDLSVIDAFKDSYYFVKGFFWPMALVTFIKAIFEGDGNRQNKNRNGFNVDINLPGINSDILRSGLSGINLFIILPVLLIGLIAMAIVVYLDQLIFVVYARREMIE